MNFQHIRLSRLGIKTQIWLGTEWFTKSCSLLGVGGRSCRDKHRGPEAGGGWGRRRLSLTSSCAWCHRKYHDLPQGKYVNKWNGLNIIYLDSRTNPYRRLPQFNSFSVRAWVPCLGASDWLQEFMMEGRVLVGRMSVWKRGYDAWRAAAVEKKVVKIKRCSWSPPCEGVKARVLLVPACTTGVFESVLTFKCCPCTYLGVGWVSWVCTGCLISDVLSTQLLGLRLRILDTTISLMYSSVFHLDGGGFLNDMVSKRGLKWEVPTALMMNIV